MPQNAKKYKGIVFTDSKGNIINDNSPENEADFTVITEITGVGNTMYPVSSTSNTTRPISDITGVGVNSNGNTGVDVNSNGNTTLNDDNTGVGINENTTSDETEDLTSDDIYNNTQEEMEEEAPVPELRETHATQETEDSNNYTYEVPTRHEIEAIEEMNSTNMRNYADFTSKNMDTAVEDNNGVAEVYEAHTERGNSASHGYNLRPRPTRRHEKLNLLQVTRQSTCEAVGEKPHLHVLMMQMSEKAGIKKFGEKGNKAVSKELRQLHDRKAMVPVLKHELSP